MMIGMKISQKEIAKMVLGLSNSVIQNPHTIGTRAITKAKQRCSEDKDPYSNGLDMFLVAIFKRLRIEDGKLKYRTRVDGTEIWETLDFQFQD